ncbi:diphthine--ammonia ligase isoform X2 [Phyllobates terribilis]
MYQTVGHQALDHYAEAMALPLYRATLSGSSLNTGQGYTPQEGDEVEDLYRLLKLVKDKEAVDSVSVGAILSDYQRVRVENVCQRLGLQPLAFLWRRKQEDLLNEMISSGLHAIVIKVAAFGLDPKHLGKSLEEMRPLLMKLSSQYGVHVCGEGGEYETLTLDCPLFKKKIMIDSSEVVMHSNDAFAPVAYLRVSKLHLEAKVGCPTLAAQPCSCDTLHPLLDETAVHGDLETQATSFSPQPWATDAVIQQSSSSLGGFRWISEIIGMGRSVHEAVHTALSSLKAKAHEVGLQMSDAALVHVYVGNMDDFASINTEYAALFTTAPPARVCVQCCLPQDTLLKMDVLFWQRRPVTCEEDCPPEKIAMHVQSISHWAPANIGPYSQAVRVGGAVFCAGQIALIPCTMQLIPGGIVAQSRLSLRHVDSVLAAISPGISTSHVLVAHCYVTQSSYIRCAKEAWESAAENQNAHAALIVAVVPRLPRGAVVEWHVMAAVSDPNGRRNISVTKKSPGFQVTLHGSVSSCETCASLVLYLSVPALQTDPLDRCNVRQTVKTVLHKVSTEFPKDSPLIPVCCRVFHRSDAVRLIADLPEILREVWGENAPCLALVPVVELSNSEHLFLSMWFSS